MDKRNVAYLGDTQIVPVSDQFIRTQVQLNGITTNDITLQVTYAGAAAPTDETLESDKTTFIINGFIDSFILAGAEAGNYPIVYIQSNQDR